MSPIEVLLEMCRPILGLSWLEQWCLVGLELFNGRSGPFGLLEKKMRIYVRFALARVEFADVLSGVTQVPVAGIWTGNLNGNAKSRVSVVGARRWS